MHDVDFDLNIDEVSKIEGHASLSVNVRGGEVKDVKFSVSENKRFYTQAIRGKPFAAIPQMVSRICGTCSIAHLHCSLEAVENALGVEVSGQTLLLRRLAHYGAVLRDHAMHLYLFSLPDLLGKDSVLEFKGKQEKWVKDCFAVKAAGNHLTASVAGRAIHATNAVVGGYNAFPEQRKLEKTREGLLGVRQAVLDLIQVFAGSPFKFEQDTNYVGLRAQGYSFLDGDLCDSRGLCVPEKEFGNHLQRVVIPYSQATAFEFEGDDFVVGALARMNVGREALNARTRKDAGKALARFPSNNVFDNNVAQAIECLHCVDAASELLELAEFKKEAPAKPAKSSGDGVGVIEAPRGTLYYSLKVKDDRVSFANLVIPSAQNQIRMEMDIRRLVPQVLDQPKEKIRWEIEKLIRAYDPCMSCASHFLEINFL